MSGVAVLAIVVATGETKNPATVGLLAAAEEALAAGTLVRISEVSIPSDAAALSFEKEWAARAVLSLAWQDAAHLRAHIRLHVAKTDRWTDRQIKFSPADTAHERGRTVGFAIASMWPDGAAVRPIAARTGGGASRSYGPSPTSRSPSRSVPNPPASVPAAPATVAVAPPSRSTSPEPAEETRSPSRLAARAGADVETPASIAARAIIAADRAAAAPVARTQPSTETARNTTGPTSPPGLPLPPHALGFGVAFAEGVGGPAEGFGGSVDAALFLHRWFAVRAGISARTGSVNPLPGTDVVGAIGGGVELWPLPPTSTSRLGFGVRVDLLLLRHQVFDLESSAGAQSRGAFLPAVEVGPQISVRLTGDVELMIHLGGELAMGRIEVSRSQMPQSSATIPVLRLRAETGFRLRF